MRFSGHETFPFRYAWLPKAYAALKNNSSALADHEAAMTELGLGRNMLKALCFWLHVTGIATPERDRSFTVSAFGDALLDPASGFDPYLEDVSTLWLLHWKLATHREQPVFAWTYLLNDFPRPEFTASEMTDTFMAESVKYGKKRSRVTAQQHLDVFLHCYLGRRVGPRSVREDALDCPLVELGFVQEVGERTGLAGAREPLYAFNRGPKHTLSDSLFAYALAEFWDTGSSAEATLSARDITRGHGSPGRAFQLPEGDVFEYLERLEAATQGAYTYHHSAAQPMVRRNSSAPTATLLSRVYPVAVAP